MSEWTTGGGVKIERAKEHIGNLVTGIEDFRKRDPYSVVRQEDPQAGRINYYIRVREDPPLRLGAVVGDVLHNLRSALDILFRNVWYPGGGGATDKTIEFPIYQTADGFKARFPRAKFVKKGRKKSAVDLLYAIKPYKGGNDLLWLIHEANAVDKHRLLIPALARIGVTLIDFGQWFRDQGVDPGPGFEIGLRWADPLFPVRDGAMVYGEPMDPMSRMNMNPKLPIEIAFGEVEGIKAKPILPILHQFVGEVEGVTRTFLTAGLIE